MVSDRRLLIRTPLTNVITRSIYNSVRFLARDFHEIDLLLNTTNGPSDFAQRCFDRVQDVLITELMAARPRFGLKVAGEADTIGTDEEQFWVISPISGAGNFQQAHPHFAISVAAELKGEILASAVYDPINDEMFYAERKQGVYVNERKVQPRHKAINETPVVMVTGNVSGEVVSLLLEQADLRISGSPALDLCYAACGRADAVYVGDATSSEVAAGHFILQQAEATFCGNNLANLHTDTQYLAGNKAHVDALAELLNLSTRK